MLITLLTLFITIILFVNGKIRSDIVALCALLSLMLFGVLTPNEALSGFSSSILIMMVGLFVVGGGIFQTGLALKISNWLLKLAGKSQTRLFIMVILGTSVIGGFVSNTGTIAIMLPIVVSMAATSGMSSSRLLMPLAFAGSMGGMLTLIGTPPNLIIHETLINAGFKGLSFFSFLPVGLICITLGIVLLLPLSKILVKKNSDEKDSKKTKTLFDLISEYSIAENLFRLKAISNSKAINKKLMDLDIAKKYSLQVLEIRRKPTTSNLFFKTIDQKIAEPTIEILQDDILYISGDFEKVQSLANDLGMSILDVHTEENNQKPKFGGKIHFDNIGIAEVILLPNSRLVNMNVRQAGFREKYKVNVLGIQRQKEYIIHDFRDEKLQSGDVLLIQGKWKNIESLSEETHDWVVVGQPFKEAPKTKKGKAAVAAVIMGLMIASLIVNVIPSVVSVLLASVLMILTGCLKNVEEAYKTINWQTIVLIGSMLPMGIALEKTGVISFTTQFLVDNIGGYSPYFMLACIYFATSLLTMFISNTATAVLFAPVALSVSAAVGVSPVPFLFAVTVAASMCFASPFSTPPNALVMSAGRYTFMDYVKVGLPMQIIYGLVMIVVLPLLFPF